MVRLSMSSNIPYSTADPRRLQDDDYDDDDQHDHDVPGRRISSLDYVDVEIPHAADAVPASQQSWASISQSTSSEVYPS